MSVRNSDPVQYRKVDNDRRSGVVKSLIIEFEQLKGNFDIQNGMGSEQSCSKPHPTLKSSTVNSNNLVKQRVSQFDLESERLSDKKKRHKSTSESSKNQTVTNKDFQRSKSVDVGRFEKDRYSRSRQIAPKTNKDVDRLVNPHRKAEASNDTNNNLQRKSTRKKTNHDTTKKTAEDKEEKIANIKTSQKLTKRFNFPESTIVKNETDKLGNSKHNRENSAKERKYETTYGENNRRKVRSVKSIKKVFEGESKTRSTVSRKVPRNKPLSNSDTTISNDKVVNKNTLYSNKPIEIVNNTSINTVNGDKESQNIDLERDDTYDDFCDSKENTNGNNESLESFRQNIIKSITEEFQMFKMIDEDTDDNSEDEFHEIENSMQEMQETIKELELRHSNELLCPTEEMKDETEIIINILDTSEYDEEEEAKDDLEDAETINVYRSKYSVSDEKEEDEFGKCSFGSFGSFTEAYNRTGDELVISKPAAVEYRTMSANFTSRESLVSFEEINSDSYLNSSNENVTTMETNSQTITNEDIEVFEINSSDIPEEILNNDLQNHSTSTEEPPALPKRNPENGTASNRSTLYSNTTTNSTDSMEFLCKTESEEGTESEKDVEHVYEEVRIIEDNVEIRSNSGNRYDRALKRETTIYDSLKNPRIAKVSNINSSDYIEKIESPILEDVEPKETPKSPIASQKPKKDYIIEELINTEGKYIKHLEKVVWDYMPVITDKNLPSSLIGKSPYLFGNIKKIYNATQKFYKTLIRCGNDHEEIAKTFLSYKHLFELYPHYYKNKPVADQYLLGDFKDIVANREKQLKDRLGLASNLLTPIQRLGKYKLLLEQIQKELQKNGGAPSDNIYKAIETVHKHMSRGNDFIAIDSIKDSPISLSEQGSFIRREKFNVIKPRKYEAMLFLFEEILVLTTVDPRNPEMFLYRESIKLNEMGIVTFDDQPLVFHLKRFPSYKKGAKEHHEFVIEAKKNKDKKTWTEEIEKRLWGQLVKCKEKQRELHNNQGVRNSVVELPNRVRKKKAGYSSLPSEMRKNPPQSIFYFKIQRDA